jgi:6-phosphogluconolactonase
MRPPGARRLPGGATVVVAADAIALAAQAAAHLETLTRHAMARHGRAVLALSGGTTPELTYKRLAAALRGDFRSLTLMQVDERLVPPDDARSNASMLRRCWPDAPLLRPMVPGSWPGEQQVPAGALAAAYSLMLDLQATGRQLGVPVLQVAVLGLGDDGHTASLFPGSAAAQERSRWVVPAAAPPEGLSPSVPRLTLTFPVLEAAEHLVVLVQGAGKAEIVAAILQGNEDLPAARLKQHSEAVWFLDRAAAAGLPGRRPQGVRRLIIRG